MTVDLTVAAARELAAGLLAAAGVETVAARQTAQAIVLADVWGLPSHGLLRLPFYLQRLAAGGCDPRARLRVVTDTGPLVTYDGEDGLGHWQAWRAAEAAAGRCAASGVAVAAVGRSSHCGALGVYTLPLLAAGFVGLVFSNGPAVMPPWGGSVPVLSTSPIAAGVPCRPRPAIVDLATSAVARGKIASHAQRGEPIPEGWAFTAAGEPTTDAKAALAGMLAPLGGAKGFALAFLVEALTGGLVGPALSTGVTDMFAARDASRPQRISHLIVAFDPARLDVGAAAGGPADVAAGAGGPVDVAAGAGGPADPGSRLDELGAAVRAAGGRLPGSRRLLPAEVDGQAPLDIGEQVLAELGDWARRMSVPMPSGKS